MPAALDEARASVSADPRDAESHELLIDILMNMGLGASASEAYALLAAQHPNEALYACLAGRAATDAGAARAAYSRALDLDPGLGRAWLGLAAVDRAEGLMGDALVKYREALALDPTLSEAWTALRLLALSAGDRDAALALAFETIQAVPGEPDAYLAVAALQPTMALATLAKGAAAVPDEPRLHAALGEALAAAGKLEEARDSLARALAILPASPRLTLTLALVEARQAGTLDGQGEARLSQSRALVAEGRPGEARKVLDEVVARYPDTFLSWYARGNLLAENRAALGGAAAMSAAASDLRRAYALAPESPDVQAALGLTLLALGDASEAAPLLANASVQRPVDVQLALASARAYAATPGDPRGLTMMSSLIERFPADPRTYMTLAQTLTASGDTARAYEVLALGLQRTGDPALLVALAAAAAELGRADQAADLLQQLGDASGSQAFLDAAARLRAPR